MFAPLRAHSLLQTAAGKHVCRHLVSSAAPPIADPILQVSKSASGVIILLLNNPLKYNAWNEPMLRAMAREIAAAEADASVIGIVLTGKGKFYCAGVDLASVLTLQRPSQLKQMIYENNKMLFLTFLTVKKPLVVAVNGNIAMS